MAFKELTTTEVDELLTGERAMRIGFDANGERYLVPSDSSGTRAPCTQ